MSNVKSKATTVTRDANAAEQQGIRRRNRHGNTEVADWAGISEKLIANVVANITARKCGVMFGYTRDGGAYSLRIVGDGEPYNEYCRPTEDPELWLNGIIEDFST